jgi:DsbC/DsbD-like thiol-disulfide interchange protein
MKKLMMVLLLLISAIYSKAQINDPVHWAYGIKHLNGNQYEVHLQATMEEGWHIYAQKQLPEAVAVPTRIRFAQTPGLTILGKPIELGNKDKYTIPAVGITNMEYAGKVDFVQKVAIKPGIKEIRGTVSYQTCTHAQCLPEATINFTVPVPK